MKDACAVACPDLACADFDEVVYRAWNPDVDAAVLAGTLASGRVHFETFARTERRPPYDAPEGPSFSPYLSTGDNFIQPIVPSQDWWSAVAVRAVTRARPAHLVLECRVRRAGDVRSERAFQVEDWVGNCEKLYLKFPPIEACKGQSWLFEIRVLSAASDSGVQLVCEPAGSYDGLQHNGGLPAAVRVACDALFAPPLVEGPAGITLNPVSYCSGGCIHCLARSHQTNPGSLKPEWTEALRKHFSEGPGAAWCIDYATDFFHAARRRPDWIDLLTARGTISVNTEGQHVTESALRHLMTGEVKQLGFSCDAATEATYARIRKGLGTLHTVLEAARLAVKLRKESGQLTRPSILLTMVVMRENVDEMAGLVDLAAAVGADGVAFNHLWVCSEDMIGQSLAFDVARWRAGFAAAEERGRELKVSVFTGADLRPEYPQHGISWCPEPWSAMVVLGNGDVLACASPASRIGSLRENTIAEIWNGPAFQELRRRVNSGQPPLMCQHCFVYRKPGNTDGLFTHHLLDGYDLREDLRSEDYAQPFRERFATSPAPRPQRSSPPSVVGGLAEAATGPPRSRLRETTNPSYARPIAPCAHHNCSSVVT